MSRKVTDRTVYLFHISPIGNFVGITYQGLRPDLATGSRQRVWLATASAVEARLAHVFQQHNCSPDEMDLYQVSIRRSALIRTRWRGIWTTANQVPACKVVWCGRLTSAEARRYLDNAQ